MYYPLGDSHISYTDSFQQCSISNTSSTSRPSYTSYDASILHSLRTFFDDCRRTMYTDNFC